MRSLVHALGWIKISKRPMKSAYDDGPYICPSGSVILRMLTDYAQLYEEMFFSFLCLLSSLFLSELYLPVVKMHASIWH